MVVVVVRVDSLGKFIFSVALARLVVLRAGRLVGACKPQVGFIVLFQCRRSQVSLAADRPQPTPAHLEHRVRRRRGRVQIWNVTQVSGADRRREATPLIVCRALHAALHLMSSRQLSDVAGRRVLLHLGTKTGHRLQPKQTGRRQSK